MPDTMRNGKYGAQETKRTLDYGKGYKPQTKVERGALGEMSKKAAEESSPWSEKILRLDK